MAEPNQRAFPRRTEALLLALCLLSFGFFFDREPGTNALAHYDQSVSIALFHELSIDRVLFLEQGGDRFAYTMDWARRAEHYYPAKAPGLSLAGAPFVWALAAAERAAGRDPLEPRVFAANAQILVWLLSVLPSALAVVALARLSRALGASPGEAIAGSLAVTVGTIFAPFASVLYAHAPTGAALALASVLVLAGPPTRRRAGLAGALGGVAVLLTYQAALALPLLAAALWWRAREPRLLAAFVAGGLPALAVHVAYHAAAFGSPFRLAYDFQNPLYGGTGGQSYVTTLFDPGEAPGRILQLTVLPYRGLFVYSPFVLLCVLRAIQDVRDTKTSREKKLAAGLGLSVLAAFVFVHALHRGWWGGFSTGPRYLVPALPLLASAAASAWARWPRIAAFVLALSLANATAITVVSVSVDERVRVPLIDIYLGLVHGQVGRTGLGPAIGLSGRAGLIPYLMVGGLLCLALARSVRGGEAPPREPAAAA